MAKYNDEQLKRGAVALREHIDGILSEHPEIGDFHDAFEYYAANKLSLGSSASTMVVGGKHQKGIDFYSHLGGHYCIGQCKTPEPDWLEAHPDEIKTMNTKGVNDLSEALEYLFGDGQVRS